MNELMIVAMLILLTLLAGIAISSYIISQNTVIKENPCEYACVEMNSDYKSFAPPVCACKTCVDFGAFEQNYTICEEKTFMLTDKKESEAAMFAMR